MPVGASADLEKLKQGVVEFVSAPTYIARDAIRLVDENPDQEGMALIGGLLDGSAHMLHSMVFGLFKMITFPIDGC